MHILIIPIQCNLHNFIEHTSTQYNRPRLIFAPNQNALQLKCHKTQPIITYVIGRSHLLFNVRSSRYARILHIYTNYITMPSELNHSANDVHPPRRRDSSLDFRKQIIKCEFECFLYIKRYCAFTHNYTICVRKKGYYRPLTFVRALRLNRLF